MRHRLTVVGVVSNSRAISRVPVPFRRFQHDPYPQQLPLFRGRRTRPRLQNRTISRPQPHFHGIRYHAILNQGAKHRDSAIMTHSLQIVGTSANCVVFWLWARAAFDDDFVPRFWHGVLWAAVVVAQWLDASGITRSAALELAIERTLSFTSLGLTLLA